LENPSKADGARNFERRKSCRKMSGNVKKKALYVTGKYDMMTGEKKRIEKENPLVRQRKTWYNIPETSV